MMVPGRRYSSSIKKPWYGLLVTVSTGHWGGVDLLALNLDPSPWQGFAPRGGFKFMEYFMRISKKIRRYIHEIFRKFWCKFNQMLTKFFKNFVKYILTNR